MKQTGNEADKSLQLEAVAPYLTNSDQQGNMVPSHQKPQEINR